MRSSWIVCLALAGCGSVSNEKKDAAVTSDDTSMVDTPMADTPPTCAATPALLKARYRAENNANDHTGAFNGTAVGANFTYVPGKYGNAFSLDGTEDLVTINDTELLWPNDQSLTLEGWFKTTGGVSSDGLVCKYACGDQCPTNMSNAYFCLFLTTNRNPAFDFRADGEVAVSQVVATSITLDDGNWHHLVAVRDVTNQSATLYVDGAPAATITPGAAAFGPMTDDDSNEDLVVIGGAVEAGAMTYDTFFNGQLDEIAIYHSALTAAQVSAIYTAPDGKCL